MAKNAERNQKMKVKQTINDIFDRTEKQEKNAKVIFLVPLIPTMFLVIFVLMTTQIWDIGKIILYPFGIIGVYLISVAAILDLSFGFSIYQVLSPILNRKIKRLFNTPNRIDELEQKIETQNNIINNSNLQQILEQIAETYQNLDNQKLPEIITNLYQDMAKMKAEIENLKIKQTDSLFQCAQCRNTFTALRPDHIFNMAMKEKCSVCDMLNMMMFRRETYICESCEKTNQIFWHHKDLHTIEENRRAEKLFFESD